MEPLLTLTDVSRQFSLDGRIIKILDSVSLAVERKEILGVIGSSGAGKTTLLHVMGGLDKPTSGLVEMDGVGDVFSQSENNLAAMRSKRIGFVFQAHMLLSEFSAIENVALASMVAGKSKDESYHLAAAQLGQVGLSHRENHRPGKLSGGEQQRVAIARALVNKPDLLLADEPTGNLDTTTGAAVFELLLDLNRQSGQTCVVVTHNMELAAKMNRVVQIRDGLIVDLTEDMIS